MIPKVEKQLLTVTYTVVEHSATNPKTEGSIQCTTQRKEPGTVFTTLHLFRNIRISSSVTLHIAESPANNKHSSLLAQLLSYISFCIQGL
jgi:hypothetical protein